jgi:hypothetical protein
MGQPVIKKLINVTVACLQYADFTTTTDTLLNASAGAYIF